MDVLRRAGRDGFAAGLAGAAGVALWFLIVDTIDGHPFYTPSLLGSALFFGVRDPALVRITFATVVSYTMVHVLAFWAIGTVAAALAILVERFPSTLFVIVVCFLVFEIGFYLLVATLAQELLGALAWTNVAVGNALAAGGMGYYLWRLHPRIRDSLAAHPLGESE